MRRCFMRPFSLLDSTGCSELGGGGGGVGGGWGGGGGGGVRVDLRLYLGLVLWDINPVSKPYKSLRPLKTIETL